jgi:hypothetical protein
MRGKFKEFDWTHKDFLNANPMVQEIYRKSFNSKMTGSEFIALMSKVKSRSKNSRQRSSYRNAHKMHEKYQKLDDIFNFFGKYNG